MTFTEWKARLMPAGILFICYFAAPILVQGFMGANNTIRGGLTFSVVIQAGLGLAVVYKLFGLKQVFKGELLAWLGRFGQAQAETQDLAGKISLAAGFVSIIAVLGPPAGEIFSNTRLLTFVKVSVLVYAVYLGYTIWKLAEPFISYVPAAETSADPAAPSPAPGQSRCVKCGQLMEDPAKPCGFCRHPVQ